MSASADSIAWVMRAHDNLQAASDLLGAGNWPLGVCLHAQQTIEMSIKSVMVEKGERFEFTHDLEKLVADLPVDAFPAFLDDSADREQISYLTTLWLERYPTRSAPASPTWSDATSSLDLAEKALGWAMAQCDVTLGDFPENANSTNGGKGVSPTD